jgi:hypothetical protein
MPASSGQLQRSLLGELSAIALKLGGGALKVAVLLDTAAA